ncbi:OmpA family protein [Rhodovulum sp. DZ06]|uniref:OmpA family protein n=1 Tax=Rhodovulum sp. DZ06 TaxID=3425126 RepID=UPI003D3486C8
MKTLSRIPAIAPRAGVISVTAAAMLLAGCANNDGPSNRQVGGALIGAAIGAAAGTLVGGNDRRNALVGAGVGLIAGAAAGTYLDEQERRLNQDLADTGADVQRVGDALLVTLPEGITFDTGSAEIKPQFSRPLTQVAQTLNAYPSTYIDVIGHTDSRGAEEFNQQLSEARASAVRRALVQRSVAVERIVAYGRGESQPIASNATREGQAANRRVEILITPATQG